MCRRAARLLPLLLLTGAVRGEARSPPAEAELLPAAVGEEEPAAAVNYTGYQVLRVQVTDNSTAELLRRYEDRPGE